MEIKYNKTRKVKPQMLDLWISIGVEFNQNGIQGVMKRQFVSPLTGKPYSQAGIYYILKRLKTI